MKRLISIFLVLVFCFLPLTARADERAVVSDMECLLSSDEVYALMDSIYQLENTYGINIMIVTASGYGGKSAQQYADDYYDGNGGGEDGVLFLLSLSQREWYISTCGQMIYVLTDYSIQKIGEASAAYFGSGDYYGGFEVFLEALPDYLDAYEAGSPVDGYADYSGSYYHGDAQETVYYETGYSPNILISLCVGLLAAAIGIFAMKSAMNNKRPQRGAAVYLKDGSWHLTGHQDLFLYSNISKQRRQQNTSSGGGSSVHRSSGGRSHGGGGGRF